MAKKRKKGKNTVKVSKGHIYQKYENSNYYYRYQVGDERKAVSLKTKNKEKAIEKVETEIIPLINASSAEVVAAHVQYVKGWKQKQERLELDQIWQTYETHPERVRPKSQKVWNMYKAYLKEFLSWLKENHPAIRYMDEIRDVDSYGKKTDLSVVNEYAEYLKTQKLAVDTHNKKISRVANIFKTLAKYLEAPSPWDNKKLKRLPKEESYITDHRKPFPTDKEKEMFEAVKAKSSFKLLNKAEIEVLLYILKYTGQRQKDCVNLSWNKVNMDRRRLWVTQEKTGKDVTIPMAPELYEMLKKAEAWREENNDKVLPKSAKRYAKKAKDGTDTGVNLINKQLLNVIKHTGLEPSKFIEGRSKKLTIYGVHSFRHSFASHCATSGVPRAVCASILGADANIIDTYYVDIGEEAQEKAIMVLSNSNSKTDKERIESALNIINNLDDSEKNDTIKAIEEALS